MIWDKENEGSSYDIDGDENIEKYNFAIEIREE